MPFTYIYKILTSRSILTFSSPESSLCLFPVISYSLEANILTVISTAYFCLLLYFILMKLYNIICYKKVSSVPCFFHSTECFWVLPMLLSLFIVCSFLLLCSLLSYEHSTIHLLILIMMGIWIVSNFEYCE